MSHNNSIKSIKNVYPAVNLWRRTDHWDHWWRWYNIKDWFRWLINTPKRVYYRAKLGWCTYDMWDFDHYILGTLCTGLRYFAETNWGCPSNYIDDYGDEEGFTKWKEEILEEADRFEKIRNYYESGADDLDYTAPDYQEKVLARNEEIEALTRQAFDWLATHIIHLWW